MPKLKSKQIKRTYFNLLLTLLLIFVIMRYALQINIPRVLYLIIIAVIIITGNRNQIIAMCMCCIPLHECIDFYYAMVICVAGYAIKYHKDIRFNYSLILGLFMVIWELLHSIGDNFGIISFLTTVIPLMTLVTILNADVSRFDYAFIAKSVAVTTAAVCLTLLGRVLYISNFSLSLAFTNLRRLGMVSEDIQVGTLMSGGEMNPNGLGIICVLASTGLMQLVCTGKGEVKDIACVCMLLVFGALTSSRTYLVCLALMVLLLTLSQQGALSQKVGFLVVVVLILLLSIAVLYIVFPELLQYYYSRFQVRDLTTGRMDLMEKYHEFILSNPKVMLFGIGLQNFVIKVTVKYNIAVNVPHNSIQELIIAWGLPGVVLFGMLVIVMIWRSKHFCVRQGLINYILLLIILIKGLAGQMLNSPYTMLALSYAYLSLCTDFTMNTKKRILTRTCK